MFVTVVAVLCHLSAQDCTEVVVTNSALDQGVTMQGCMLGGQASLAQWKTAHPSTDPTIGASIATNA